jgi:5'-nucleotidase
LTYELATTVEARDCTAVSISNVVLNGLPLNLSGRYIVTLNSFLSDGGDNFGTFDDVTSPKIKSGETDLQALTNYLGTFCPVAPQSTDRDNELR